MEDTRLSSHNHFRREYRETLLSEMRLVIENHENVQEQLFEVASDSPGYQELIDKRSHIEVRYLQLELKIKKEFETDNIYKILNN